MVQEVLNERLSQISTLWSLIQQMHGGPAEAATAAQQRLMQRYCGAVYRYLLGALRDEEASLELFQEFALRFVRGDFRRADPQCGRFRDYVKTALIHLVSDYHKAQRERPRPLHFDVPDPRSQVHAREDAEFVHGWREELVNRAWETLAQVQPTFHATLLMHVQDPELPSTQLAARLTTQLGKPFTATNVRVTLHRARAKFADLLLDEVAHSLENPTAAELLQELHDLRLRKLCGLALKRRSHRG
jgi:RNA polymerase sigma-70 factor (ECF subfamily)